MVSVGAMIWWVMVETVIFQFFSVRRLYLHNLHNYRNAGFKIKWSCLDNVYTLNDIWYRGRLREICFSSSRCTESL